MDKVDAAIAAVEELPPAREFAQVQFRVSSGAMISAVIPTDISDVEILDLVASLTTQIRRDRKTAAPRRPALWHPGG